MSAVADKLREARALIERGWTQQAPARNRSGMPVAGDDESAICWCAVSAAVTGGGGGTLVPLRKAIGLAEGEGIAEWNDAPERTQAEVLAAFDKAIALAESDQ